MPRDPKGGTGAAEVQAAMASSPPDPVPVGTTFPALQATILRNKDYKMVCNIHVAKCDGSSES